MSLRNRKAMVEVIQYAYKKIDIINENLNKSIHRNLIGNRKQKKKNKKSKKTKNDNENTNCENENGEKKIDNNHGMSVLIDKEEEYLQWIPDAEFFISNMIEMNEKKLSNYTLADRVSTLRYGAIGVYLYNVHVCWCSYVYFLCRCTYRQSVDYYFWY